MLFVLSVLRFFWGHFYPRRAKIDPIRLLRFILLHENTE